MAESKKDASEKTDAEVEASILAKLESTDDVMSALPEVLEYVRSFSGASSVYIGRKQAGKTEESDEDEENAFLKYIAATKGDEHVMGTYLKGSEGVTFDAFKKVEADEEEAEEKEAEEGDESAAEAKREPEFKPVHIANVLRDRRVRFFGNVPRFGAYLAVPCKYKSCRNQASLEKMVASLDSKTEEKKVVEDDAENDGDDAADAAAEKEAEAEDDAADDEEATEAIEFAATSLAMEDTEMVICLDTIGKNVPGGFAPDVVDKVQNVARLLSAAFERSDLTALKADADLVKADAEAREGALAQIDALASEEASKEDEKTEEGDETAPTSEEAKRVDDAIAKLARATKIIEALKDDVLRVSKYSTPPKAAALSVLTAFLRTVGVAQEDLEDLGVPSWSKIASEISESTLAKVSNFDATASTFAIDAVRGLIEGQSSADLRSKSLSASVLLEWVESVVEVREASAAKAEADAAAAAAAAEAEAEKEADEGDE